MRHTKIWIICIAVVTIALVGIGDVIARGGGGGGHAGGGGYSHGGGGWSGGGHGGGGGDHGGDRTRPDHNPDRNPNRDHDWHNHDHDWQDHNNTYNKNVTVNGNGNGWYNYGAANEALAGMMMITAMGAVAARPSDSTTVIIEQPSEPSSKQQKQQEPAIPAIGAQVVELPQGCQAKNISGTLYYQSGSAWYRPYFGASGVYYQVVQQPA